MTYIDETNKSGTSGGGTERIERLEARALSLGIELHAAATTGDVEQIAALIERGAKPDARAPDGSTPLHTAARHGQSAAVAALLQADVDPDARNVDGTKPLHLAASAGSIELLVAYGADTEAWDAAERTALDRLPRNSPAPLREMCMPAGERTPEAAEELRGQGLPDPEPRPDGAEGRNHETTPDMTGRDGEAAPDRGEASGPRPEAQPAGNGRSTAGQAYEITLKPDLTQEPVRQRVRNDQLLQLACMATERIAPEQRASWGDLRQRIGEMLDAVDKAPSVPEEAVEAKAQKTARKRAESDVWVKAAREAGGGMLHQASARFTGSAEFYRQEQMERNAAAITKGLEGLTQDVLRPNNLERTVAKAVLATAGTKDEEVARALEGGLRLGWVPAAASIRMDQEEIVDTLSRPMDQLGELERTELTDRVYRTFPEDEIRAVSRGEGPAARAARDPEAKTRLVENFKSLHAEPVDLPTPWRGLHVEIGVSAGVAREQLQPERSAEAAAERNVVSASM